METKDKLQTVPDGVTLPVKTKIVAGNAKVWGKLVQHISTAGRLKIAAGRMFIGLPLEEAFSREGKARFREREVPLPNPWGIYSLVNNFFLRTFRLKRFATRYNDNILAFKQLVEAVVAGVTTLTPASRDAWWRTHQLPKDLVLFSITGSMPEAFLGDFASPLSRFAGFGTKTSDYNVSLRASYYDTLSSENTLMNDSQMSHFGSRYWKEMYPQHQYTHYYLGILGTHHWGMALPFTIKDDAKVGSNPFPRTTLLKSVAAFIASLDRDKPPV
jgi:hypothetical protein